MKIQRLYIDGFGRLNQAAFDLAPGLNVFGGPNEAGKSTLQKAILVLLYGFFNGNHRTADENKLLEQYRPWQGSPYGGWLEYRLDCSGAFKVSRSVDGAEVRTSVQDLRTGGDISNTFARDRLGNLDLPLRHFGVPRDVFFHTYFIRQEVLGPLVSVAAEVADTISDSTGTNRRNRTAMRAEELLRAAMAVEVGTRLSNDTPLANADERVHELLIEQTLIKLKYRNLAEDLVTQSRCKRSLQEWTAERDELKYLLSVNRLNALTYRIREVDKLAAAESALRDQLEELKAAADFPLKTRQVVTELGQRQRTHVERLARLEGMAAPARAQVEELQSDAARVREEVRRLESARNVPLEYEPTVRELEHALPEAIRAYQKTEADLTGVRQSLSALEPARNAAARRKSLVSGGPQKVHELRIKWQSLQAQIADAEREHAGVDEAWRAQDLPEVEYTDLAHNMSAVTPETIDELRAQQATTEYRKAQIEASRAGWAARTLGAAGAVAAFIGLTLLLITVLVPASNWMVEGAVFVLVGLIVAATAWGLSIYQQHDRAAIERSVAAHNRRLNDLGVGSIRELETAQRHYLQAKPLYEAWRNSKETLDKYYREREALRTSIVPLLELPEGSGINDEQMSGLEDYTRGLGTEIDEVNHLEQHRSQLEAELKVRREAMQQVIDSTRQILKAAGMVELNLLTDLRSFLVLCENRKGLDKLDSQLADLDTNLAAKLESTLAVEADMRSERSKLMGVEEELRLVLLNVGIHSDNLEEGVKLFNQRCEQAERYTRVQSILHSLERERKALLRSLTTEQIKQQAEVFNQSIQALLAAYPDLSGKTSDKSEEALEESLFEVQHRLNTTTHALNAVEVRLQSGTADYRNLAEVDEEIAREQARMERLTFEGRAINFALDNLAAAADDYHRNFLPRLNQMVANSLDAVTKGHYSKVQIDRADLRVQVESPELQQLIAPERLSQGIQDQVYLLLRFGLAAMISEGRESLPFLLDDPFVNYDHEHLMRTLNLLAKTAEQSQLLVFTKDEVIVDWFKNSPFDPAQHRLHEMH